MHIEWNISYTVHVNFITCCFLVSTFWVIWQRIFLCHNYRICLMQTFFIVQMLAPILLSWTVLCSLKAGGHCRVSSKVQWIVFQKSLCVISVKFNLSIHGPQFHHVTWLSCAFLFQFFFYRGVLRLGVDSWLCFVRRKSEREKKIRQSRARAAGPCQQSPNSPFIPRRPFCPTSPPAVT